MAHSSPIARSAPRRAINTYAPPAPLEDLHILDVLELVGSQSKAARALDMHQSTVCRSLQLMQHQIKLASAPGSKVCRYGSNPCLYHLRMAYREHRLMANQLRIATDPLHIALLLGMDGIQQVPPRFRSADHWAELIQHGLLDGAILTSFSLSKPLRESEEPTWDEIAVFPLGSLQLKLVAQEVTTRQVLLPRKLAMPLLPQALETHDFAIEQQPAACQETSAWLKRARDRKLAIPVCPELIGQAWLDSHRLELLAEQPPIKERLWLLFSHRAIKAQAAQRCLRRLRLQLSKARIMQDRRGC